MIYLLIIIGWLLGASFTLGFRGMSQRDALAVIIYLVLWPIGFIAGMCDLLYRAGRKLGGY